MDKHDLDKNCLLLVREIFVIQAIYNGIHFLNEEQETLLRGYLEGQNHIIGLQRFGLDNSTQHSFKLILKNIAFI